MVSLFFNVAEEQPTYSEFARDRRAAFVHAFYTSALRKTSGSFIAGDGKQVSQFALLDFRCDNHLPSRQNSAPNFFQKHRRIDAKGKTRAVTSRTRTPSISVAIPCFNEAKAIASVVREWKTALPEAEIIVFDNGSTDGGADLAREAGAKVEFVSERGKGNVVRVIFALLIDRDAVVMVDGDGTYPAKEVGPLIIPILTGEADMTVGARRPVAELKAMSPVRGFGNVLIRFAFLVLIGRGPGDLLSGYRVFGPRFLANVRPNSRGFEIETELTAEAIAHDLKIVEVAVSYHPRVAGTSSKLRAFRDGFRILMTILNRSARLRPIRLGLLVLGSAAFCGFVAWKIVQAL